MLYTRCMMENFCILLKSAVWLILVLSASGMPEARLYPGLAQVPWLWPTGRKRQQQAWRKLGLPSPQTWRIQRVIRQKIPRMIQVMPGDSLNMMEITNALYMQVIIELITDQQTLLAGPGSLLYLTVVKTRDTKDVRMLNISSQAQNHPHVNGSANA